MRELKTKRFLFKIFQIYFFFTLATAWKYLISLIFSYRDKQKTTFHNFYPLLQSILDVCSVFERKNIHTFSETDG